MLLLLEGQTLHLAALITMYAKDILFDNDMLVFATGKDPVKYLGKYNTSDERDDEMMAVRWKIFEFSHQIPVGGQKDIPSCPRCFAELIVSGSNF